MDRTQNRMDYKSGSLPRMRLAMAYVPLQDSAAPSYESIEALSRGTLFPGLDLPITMNIVNDNLQACPCLTELMAIDFAADELELYLDTHCDDSEAAMYQIFSGPEKRSSAAM
ncbi:MAG: spore coat associated protein CotJA [Oscillospiraceae bacterium]